MKDILERLQEGCNYLGLDISYEKCISIIKYVALLNKWNQVFNLTSIKDQKEVISLHILDSLAILPYLDGYSLLDVGTGAGLPGIPIAIAKPCISVSLIDSSLKKNVFTTSKSRISIRQCDRDSFSCGES